MTLRVHQILKGKSKLGDADSLRTKLTVKPAVGSLLVYFETRGDDEELASTAIGVNETSLAYFARAPDLRQPASKRLRTLPGFWNMLTGQSLKTRISNLAMPHMT